MFKVFLTKPVSEITNLIEIDHTTDISEYNECNFVIFVIDESLFEDSKQTAKMFTDITLDCINKPRSTFVYYTEEFKKCKLYEECVKDVQELWDSKKMLSTSNPELIALKVNVIANILSVTMES